MARNFSCALSFRLNKIKEVPGLTDKILETDPAQAPDWLFDFENACKKIYSVGDHGAEMEAVVFSKPTIYNIIQKFPYSINNTVYDIAESG